VLGALIAVVVVFVALIALGLALDESDETAGTTDSSSQPAARPTGPVSDDELDVAFFEDFSSGPGPLGEWEDDAYGAARVVDGAYVLSNPTTWSATYSAAPVGASDTIEVRAALALRTDIGEGGMGITVLDDNEAGYLLAIYPGLGADISAKSSRDADWTTLLDSSTPVPTSSVEVRMTVTVSDSGTKIVGYVDGSLVIRYVDTSSPYSNFSLVGPAAISGEAPATVEADYFEVLN
jgi:hypothetical protein